MTKHLATTVYREEQLPVAWEGLSEATAAELFRGAREDFPGYNPFSGAEADWRLSKTAEAPFTFVDPYIRKDPEQTREEQVREKRQKLSEEIAVEHAERLRRRQEEFRRTQPLPVGKRRVIEPASKKRKYEPYGGQLQKYQRIEPSPVRLAIRAPESMVWERSGRYHLPESVRAEAAGLSQAAYDRMYGKRKYARNGARKGLGWNKVGRSGAGRHGTNLQAAKRRRTTKTVPAAYVVGAKPRAPTTTTPRPGVTRITGSNVFRSALAGSTGFLSTRDGVNPGDAVRFPWLSDRALGYSRYRWVSLTFKYVPAQASTSIGGSVYLYANYDAEQRDVDTLALMSTYGTLAESRSFTECLLKVPVSKMFAGVQNKKIRCGAVATDLMNYDGCMMVTCTDGQPDTNVIGNVWVFYTIDLFYPITIAPLPTPVTLSQFILGANQTITSAAQTTIAFDETVVDGIGITNTSGVFTIPCGMFEVTCGCTCADTTTTTLIFRMELFVDAAVLGQAVVAATELPSTVTPESYLGFSAFMRGNALGTTTFSIRVTITAGGTITLRADECRVLIRVLA